MNFETPERAAWLRIAASPSVREQQVAFTCATGVPLAIAPASAQSSTETDRVFCVKGCLGGHSGTVCSRKLIQAEKRAVTRDGPVQYCCPSGLVKIVVPVFIGGQHVGSLLAGPFALRTLEGGKLNQLVGKLEKCGLNDRVAQLQTSWRFSPLLSSDKCRAAATLLQMFARYLEESGKQELRSQRPRSSSLVQKVESFLKECRNSHVSLKEVATRVNLSPCHFCAVFKKQAGVTFSQYRTRQRLEKARELLAHSERRISDVAFEAGFESIPYFNRAFRARFGCSPSEFRLRQFQRNSGQVKRNPGVAAKRPVGLNGSGNRAEIASMDQQMPFTPNAGSADSQEQKEP